MKTTTIYDCRQMLHENYDIMIYDCRASNLPWNLPLKQATPSLDTTSFLPLCISAVVCEYAKATESDVLNFLLSQRRLITVKAHKHHFDIRKNSMPQIRVLFAVDPVGCVARWTEFRDVRAMSLLCPSDPQPLMEFTLRPPAGSTERLAEIYLDYIETMKCLLQMYM